MHNHTFSSANRGLGPKKHISSILLTTPKDKAWQEHLLVPATSSTLRTFPTLLQEAQINITPEGCGCHEIVKPYRISGKRWKMWEKKRWLSYYTNNLIYLVFLITSQAGLQELTAYNVNSIVIISKLPHYHQWHWIMLLWTVKPRLAYHLGRAATIPIYFRHNVIVWDKHNKKQ